MQESQWCSVNYGFGLEVEAYEQEKELARLKKMEEAFKWCQERHARIDCTGSNVVVEVPGFDTIVAESLAEAVQLAIELEEDCTPPVQQEWLPSAAELDEIEAGLEPPDNEHDPTMCYCGDGFCHGCEAAEEAEEENGAYFL